LSGVLAGVADCGLVNETGSADRRQCGRRRRSLLAGTGRRGCGPRVRPLLAAENRAIFLGDHEAIEAVRRLLESFIRIGWHQAIELAEELDELFN
jgi:hypothetical protein